MAAGNNANGDKNLSGGKVVQSGSVKAPRPGSGPVSPTARGGKK